MVQPVSLIIKTRPHDWHNYFAMSLVFITFHIGKTSHQYKIPALKKTISREELKRQKSEEGGELKKELMQAVKRRSK